MAWIVGAYVRNVRGSMRTWSARIMLGAWDSRGDGDKRQRHGAHGSSMPASVRHIDPTHKLKLLSEIAAAPGTVPVYVETPIAAPHSRYHHSPRDAAQAARFVWQQLGVVFHAYPYPLPQV